MDVNEDRSDDGTSDQQNVLVIFLPRRCQGARARLVIPVQNIVIEHVHVCTR